MRPSGNAGNPRARARDVPKTVASSEDRVLDIGDGLAFTTSRPTRGEDGGDEDDGDV